MYCPWLFCAPGCNKDYVAHKAETIYYLALCRESLPTHHLFHLLSWIICYTDTKGLWRNEWIISFYEIFLPQNPGVSSRSSCPSFERNVLMLLDCKNIYKIWGINLKKHIRFFFFNLPSPMIWPLFKSFLLFLLVLLPLPFLAPAPVSAKAPFHSSSAVTVMREDFFIYLIFKQWSMVSHWIEKKMPASLVLLQTWK